MKKNTEPSEAVDVSIDKIEIGKRFRSGVGPADEFKQLKNSIQDIGLQNPLVVRENEGRVELVSGFRRLKALQDIGAKVVSCRIVTKIDSALMALKAERDENSCRVNLDPVDAVALADAILAIEAPKAQERKKASQFGKGGKKEKSVNGDENLQSPQNPNENEVLEVATGGSMEKAAEAVGMSEPTLRKARKVVKAAEKDKRNLDLIDEMKKTGKVNKAYNELVKRTGKIKVPKIKSQEPEPEAKKQTKRVRCPECKHRFTVEV